MSKWNAAGKMALAAAKVGGVVSAVTGHSVAHVVASSLRVRIPAGAVNVYGKIQLRDASRLWEEGKKEWNSSR